uniref:OB-fold nucleic acid binding domain-containing protein n=1 Tax=Vibrio harveyi TaxID=669 RepID=UPI001FD62998
LPLRYEDRTRIWPIASAMPGQHLTIQGEVLNCSITFGKRRMLSVKISDGNGSATLRFFNFNAAMKNSLAEGKQVKAYGEIKRGKFGVEIIHPDYKVFSEPTELSVEETLTPVYPTTEGLRQLTLRGLTDQALKLLDKAAVSELLPDGLYDRQMTLAQALRVMH